MICCKVPDCGNEIYAHNVTEYCRDHAHKGNCRCAECAARIGARRMFAAPKPNVRQVMVEDGHASNSTQATRVLPVSLPKEPWA